MASFRACWKANAGIIFKRYDHADEMVYPESWAGMLPVIPVIESWS